MRRHCRRQIYEFLFMCTTVVLLLLTNQLTDGLINHKCQINKDRICARIWSSLSRSLLCRNVPTTHVIKPTYCLQAKLFNSPEVKFVEENYC